jgi:hypothetical protein
MGSSSRSSLPVEGRYDQIGYNIRQEEGKRRRWKLRKTYYLLCELFLMTSNKNKYLRITIKFNANVEIAPR